MPIYKLSKFLKPITNDPKGVVPAGIAKIQVNTFSCNIIRIHNTYPGITDFENDSEYFVFILRN